MGCCQDKDCHTCNEEAKETELEEVKEEDADVDTDGIDVDSPNHRNLKSNESLLITVLWRRLSMFSRRGSMRSNKKQSIQVQKQGRMFSENNPEEILEEPEKG